jgi:hypothetical protein
LETIFYGLKDPLARRLILEELEKLPSNNFASVSISFNHDPAFGVPSGDFKVLILWEPSAVMPWQYRQKCLNLFDLVIPMSVWRANRLGLNQYAFHPYTFDAYYQSSPFNNRERNIVMINSAKFSSGNKSLYGLRRSVSRMLHENQIDYALYGTGWKMSRSMELRKRFVALKNSLQAGERVSLGELTSDLWYQYPEFHGWVENKFEVLSQFKLSLVIENEADWVTEKVFDSIVAGAVPIYVGPDLSRDFPELNDCLVIADSNAEGILARISGLQDSELNEKRNAIQRFLIDKSEHGIGFWSSNNQWTKVAKIIKEKLT